MKFHRLLKFNIKDSCITGLDGIYDAESPLSKLHGNFYFMKDIWEMVTQDRSIF